jgi:hypothetical protein
MSQQRALASAALAIGLRYAVVLVLVSSMATRPAPGSRLPCRTGADGASWKTHLLAN